MQIHNNPKHFSGGSKNTAVIDFLHQEQHIKPTNIANQKQKLWLGLQVMKAIYHVDGVRGFYRSF
jgi:hypothetical protein